MIFHAVASPVVRPKVFATPCCRRRFQAEPSCDLKPKRQVYLGHSAPSTSGPPNQTGQNKTRRCLRNMG
jgi:hypothetical protein